MRVLRVLDLALRGVESLALWLSYTLGYLMGSLDALRRWRGSSCLLRELLLLLLRVDRLTSLDLRWSRSSSRSILVVQLLALNRLLTLNLGLLSLDLG